MINIFKIFGTSSGRGTSSSGDVSPRFGTSSGRGASSSVCTSQELAPSLQQENSVINNSVVQSSLCGGISFNNKNLPAKWYLASQAGILHVFGASSNSGVSYKVGTSSGVGTSWQERPVMDNNTVLAASGMAQDFVEPSGDAMVSGGSVTSSLCGGSRFRFKTLFDKRFEAEVFASFFGKILGWMTFKMFPAFRIQNSNMVVLM